MHPDTCTLPSFSLTLLPPRVKALANGKAMGASLQKETWYGYMHSGRQSAKRLIVSSHHEDEYA